MEDKRFKTLDEYTDEFKKSGEKNFYEFLERKKQEALEAGEQELAGHIEKIYDEAYEEEQLYYEALAEENIREEKEKEKRKRQEELDVYDYDEIDFLDEVRRDKKAIKRYYKQYKKLLTQIGESKRTIQETKERLEDESLDESDREWYEDIIYREELDIRNSTYEANGYKRSIELVNFETSLRSMTPEEIGETYSTLLEAKGSYYEDKLFLIEGYVRVEENYEAQKLIQAQKEKYERMAEERKQTEKELQESMEYEEALRTAPIDETPHKAKTLEELDTEKKPSEGRFIK